MDYEGRPLVQKLVAFKKENPVSFHVPGHKNGVLSGLPKSLRSALSYDLTELEGLDDLHQPTGVIGKAEQKLTDLYESDKSFFLVNGSTVGNLAMVYATCREGETVIVQRNAHKSIFSAIELTGARPVFITPKWDRHTRTATGITAEQVKSALELYPAAKAVILTYPTYYGVADQELEEAIRLAHEREIPVLVDEAHGAHFVIGESFPRSALALGADVVVHSAHKTLPAMTMASFIHIRSKLISPEKVSRYLHMLQSSSPSYLLMASLDDAREYAESFTESDIISLEAKRKSFIDKLGRIPYLQTIETDDILKLIMRVEGSSGFDVQEALDSVGVYVELADPFQVLLVFPLLKKEQDYSFDSIANLIELAVQRMSKLNNMNDMIETPAFTQDVSTLFYTTREMEGLEQKWLPYGEVEGMIAAAAIIPYPPGIPLLLAGERVTVSHIESLSSLLTTGARFQGAIKVNKKHILVVTNEVEE